MGWTWPFGGGPELRFAAAAGVIVIAGIKLVKYGDALGTRLRLGQAWVGLVLLAAVTSLPELVTSVSAAAVVREPRIALGNVFGSILFNTALLALIDAAEGQGSLFARAGRKLIFPIAFSLVLLSVAALALLAHSLTPGLRLGPIGLETPLILVIYVAGVQVLKRLGAEETPPPAPAGAAGAAKQPLLAAIAAKYALTALAILWAGLNLAQAADALAAKHELSRTFVGATLVAVATSLPEMTCTFTAARRGLVDMAIGNIFGANAFNVVIIAVADIFYLPGSIMRAAIETKEVRPQVVAILFALLMGGIALVALRVRARRTIWRLGLPSVAILAAYLTAAYLIYISA